MIKAENLVLTQGSKTVLDGVSLTAEPGRVTVVLGAEGSGKTALLDVICGVTAPDSGRVELDGIDLAADGLAARRHIGYMPQDPAVYRDMTPRGQLRFVGQVLELSARALGDRVEKVLRRTGLSDAANTPIRTLPRVHLQRFALAQALMSGAGNIVLDCPTDGLDARQIFELREIVRAVCAPGEGEEAPAVLIATDNLTEACSLGDVICVLEQGRIVGRSTPERLAYLELDDDKTCLLLVAQAEQARAALEGAKLRVVECAGEEGGLTRCAIETGKGIEGRKAVFAACAAQDLPIVEMRPAKRGMEEIAALLKSEAFAAVGEGEGAEAQ